MKTRRHTQWNIEYTEIWPSDAGQMPPAVVAAELTRLYRRLAETEFLLSCHGEGMTLPDELRHEWPADEYRDAND